MEKKEFRSLSEIASEIYSDWKNANFAAKPYLQAMRNLNSVNDNYYFDSGKDMVIYFLSNANTWRGETARRIKKELKEMIK